MPVEEIISIESSKLPLTDKKRLMFYEVFELADRHALSVTELIIVKKS